jgi:hypothetical protein
LVATPLLVIQRSEYRDTQALQAKLDELLHVHRAARNDLTRLDEKEPEDIEKIPEGERADDRCGGRGDNDAGEILLNAKVRFMFLWSGRAKFKNVKDCYDPLGWRCLIDDKRPKPAVSLLPR